MNDKQLQLSPLLNRLTQRQHQNPKKNPLSPEDEEALEKEMVKIKELLKQRQLEERKKQSPPTMINEPSMRSLYVCMAKPTDMRGAGV